MYGATRGGGMAIVARRGMRFLGLRLLASFRVRGDERVEASLGLWMEVE